MTKDIKLFEPGMPVLDVADVIRLERQTAESGTSLLTLMMRAGEAVAEAACDVLADCGDAADVAHEMLADCTVPAKKIVILAGSGNNGGDGWVAASILATEGHEVTLVSRTLPEELTAEPARTAALEAMRGKLFTCVFSPNEAEVEASLTGADIIIDAILGTGFVHSEVRSPYSGWIELANAARAAHGVPILAVDCPSGLNAQTGHPAKSCITADMTITMIAAKTGLLQPSAQKHVGKLLVAPIGVDISNSDD